MPPELWIHLAVVACGNRLEETLVMLKSAVLFSHRKMRFHIFTEDALKPEFDKQVKQATPRHSALWEGHEPKVDLPQTRLTIHCCGWLPCSLIGAWLFGSEGSFMIQKWAGEMAQFLKDSLSTRACVWVSITHHSMCL